MVGKGRGDDGGGSSIDVEVDCGGSCKIFSSGSGRLNVLAKGLSVGLDSAMKDPQYIIS
jgi:hypothetical protein